MSTASPNVQQRRSARVQSHSADFLNADTHEVSEPVDMMSSNVPMMTLEGRLDPITTREFQEMAEYEAFMEEPVVIQINDTTDKNQPPFVFVGVNGDNRWLPRSTPVRIQRKFVERLAQAQEMRFETKSNPDQDSQNAMRTVRTTAQSYGFAVIRDDHPIGRRWLARITRQGS